MTAHGGRKVGVLFDVDGTLVDSTYLHTVSWWQAFRRTGRDVAMSRIHRAIGMGADQLIPEVLDDEKVDDETADLLAQTHDAVYATHWPALRAFPGARELIQRCHDAGMVTVLASSAGAPEVSTVRELLDADQWLDEFTTSADGEQTKPAPDLVVTAMQKVDLDPSATIFIGDAVWDVTASARAGVQCITVECGGTSAAELQAAGAVSVYADPAQLLAQWDKSPLAELAS